MSYTAWSFGMWRRIADTAHFIEGRSEATKMVREIAAKLIAGGYGE